MAPLLSQVNLVFQIIILGLLFGSFMFKRRGRFFLHGSIMLVAVVLNGISFLLVMGPSLLSLVDYLLTNPSTRTSSATIAHAILGSIAEILGIWIVASWRLRPSTTYCVAKKGTMRWLFVLWIVALLLGIFVYISLYIA